MNGIRRPCTVSCHPGITERVVFVDNWAEDHGGALSLENPVALNIRDTLFLFNTADSGGAVRVASTSWAATDFQRCRFESNSGALGGAIRLDGDGRRTFQDSSFLLNVARETLSSKLPSVLANRSNDTIVLTGNQDYKREQLPRQVFFLGIRRFRSCGVLTKEQLRLRGASAG